MSINDGNVGNEKIKNIENNPEKTVAFYTLGCKVNQYETEVIRKDFLDNNYKEVEFDQKADIYIVNTCTVTNVADKKNKKMLRRAKNTNPDSIVVATGCYAQTNLDDLKEMREIDFIIGNSKKENVFSIISKNVSHYQVDNIFDEKEYSSKKYTVLREKARAFVKIQDGCTKFCSYCKIPYARGLSRSRDEKSILEEINYLGEQGYKEVVLTGINMSEYGLDLEPKTDFDTILEKILAIKSVERVRVSSVYPDTITDKFLDMLKNNPKLMPHLHVSVQTLDDKILHLMRRNYKADFVVNVLEKVKKEVPEVSLTADIIVGFPQEEKENFENTLKNLDLLGFSDLHVFPYSDREKTTAMLLDGKIDSQEKKRRVKKVEELNNVKYAEFRKKTIGSKQRVYIEEIVEDRAFGYTENYLRVFINLKKEGKNHLEIKVSDLVNTEIINFDGILLEGDII
ncbi:tRNA (N(6)-L-threonylcarbamoyladenosine(37)-C(2))-methylthiotransferase MtaB [Leptotrichia sp. OH3620_COT-345]|uniref:tRNA (N(6)-L-threonylcarbamoyladenosine(37)-C(2))- methylthiotransferase MtaB n=1 Tax=Leptotrichia sp. OH3620_COT-345 TaxID=2491048 RepID=UPI000F64CFA4|nr:tRNA (N(6)-L-threonylcarbamoyladenosine(37)-C(2))-methylthiotransferase MtaB [Leptotrichia sp. OH3620_COT-345]RRD40665.1 tRNA (N(6)-L-threonylcarbamoyladenosine(37)-C(2))-methylthiotransferase MtaB [Leptotrichia sp. OH3620_COT-345]